MNVYRGYIQSLIIFTCLLLPLTTQATSIILAEIQSGPNSVQLVFRGPAPQYRVFNLESPERIVIDLTNTKNGIGSKTIDNSNRMMKQIRLGDHPDKLRVVIDINDAKATDFEIVKLTSSLMVTSKEKVARVTSESVPTKKRPPDKLNTLKREKSERVPEKQSKQIVPNAQKRVQPKREQRQPFWQSTYPENRIGLGLYGDIFNEIIGLQAKYWHTELLGAEMRYGTGLYTEYSARGLVRYQIVEPMWVYGGLGFKHTERSIDVFGETVTPGADTVELSVGAEYFYKRASLFVEALWADVELGARVTKGSFTYDKTFGYQPVTIVSGLAWYFY